VFPSGEPLYVGRPVAVGIVGPRLVTVPRNTDPSGSVHDIAVGTFVAVSIDDISSQQRTFAVLPVAT
jgi:hypothetical protein